VPTKPFVGFVQENRAVLATFGASVVAIMGAKVFLTPGAPTADAAALAATRPQAAA
jgi:hypothetical protein